MNAFLKKLAILLPLLILLQVVVGVIYPMEIPAEIEHFQQLLAEEVEILYFGDSTVWYPPDAQTTPQILQEYFDDRTVGELSHAAYNLDLYLHYVQKLVRESANQPYRPELLIIPINMHSFAPEWDLRPEYQFTEEKRVLDYGTTWSRWFGRPYTIFGGDESPITQEMFLNTAVYSDTTLIGKVAEFEEALGNTRLAEQETDRFIYYQAVPEEGLMAKTLLYYYMAPLAPDHRKLRAMQQIVTLLQEHEIEVLFYITPVDTELGDVYIGDRFRERFTANKEVVLTLLAEQKAPVLDLSYDLPPFYFSDTEHLHQDGKRYIAEQLVAQIDPTIPLDRDFFIDTAQGEQESAEETGSERTRMAVPLEVGGIAVGTVLTTTFVARVDAAEITEASQRFYPTSNLVDAIYDVDIYRLQVQSSTEAGEAIDLQSDLYIPRIITATQLPMIAYAPGTTGLGDGCAPSNEILLGRSWGNYYTQMLSYAGQGFISLLPDGMSYDDPERPHEYFIATLEAHTLLDAARGAYNFLADPPEGVTTQPLDALFLAGYSNGGHAAFAAKDLAADYAPELPLRGVISHGATTNVETLMRESPIFSPYLIYSYQFFYGSDVFRPAQIFTEKWLPTFAQDANTKCVDEITAYYPNDPQAIYRPAFRNALESGRLAAQRPAFKRILDANYAGTFGGFDLPVLFLQGTADATVTPRAQQKFAQDLCAKEQPVTYIALPTVRHVDTRQNSFVAMFDWMRGQIDGEPMPDHCANLTGE